VEKVSRRTFVKKSSLALAGVGLAPYALTEPVSLTPKPMFIHHVFFWLKNPTSKEDKARLLKGLQSLTKIETIKMAHIGVPADTNRGVIDASYALSELFIFDNRADQDVYQEHPLHKKFIEECGHLWEKVVVYDSVDA
jgi:hypothetical protein